MKRLIYEIHYLGYYLHIGKMKGEKKEIFVVLQHIAKFHYMV